MCLTNDKEYRISKWEILIKAATLLMQYSVTCDMKENLLHKAAAGGRYYMAMKKTVMKFTPLLEFSQKALKRSDI